MAPFSVTANTPDRENAMTWQVLDQVVDDNAAFRRGAPTPGQTIAGTHASASYHYLGLARDYGMSDSDAVAISHLFAPLARSRPDLIPEMFGADGVGYSQGSPFQAPGHTGNHTHVAVAAGVTAQELESALGGANVRPPLPAPLRPAQRSVRWRSWARPRRRFAWSKSWSDRC
jgi:hypothetical protein